MLGAMFFMAAEASRGGLPLVHEPETASAHQAVGIELSTFAFSRWLSAMEQMNAEWGEDLRRRQQHITTDACFNTLIAT